MSKRQKYSLYISFVFLAGFLFFAINPNYIEASSHREAPFITEHPKVDGTDFYMFRSYEDRDAGTPGNQFGDFVTIIANYHPLQDAFGGPNYFFMDPEAIYEIHIDNTADNIGAENLSFQFRFQNQFRKTTLDVDGTAVEIPLIVSGAVTNREDPNLNVLERYTITLVEGDRRSGVKTAITNNTLGGNTFFKPIDNIGPKTLANYDNYAGQHIFEIGLPGGLTGKVFVGQREDPFVVNLGEVFDLINLDPNGNANQGKDQIAKKNITSIILELPTAFLTQNGSTNIGGWTTASLRQARLLNPFPPAENRASIEGGAFSQVSRLGMPLVNELVIGLSKKDRFNASEPVNDAQFATFVTNPTLPVFLNILFGVTPPATPRNDLVAVFLQGIDLGGGLDNRVGTSTAEMLRLNTTIAPKAKGAQNNLGVIGADTSGFPNGRRPGDDVVDIELQVVGGELVGSPNDFNDSAQVTDADFDNTFPYLKTPVAGSPFSAKDKR